jgi:hypothetical protein
MTLRFKFPLVLIAGCYCEPLIDVVRHIGGILQLLQSSNYFWPDDYFLNNLVSVQVPMLRRLQGIIVALSWLFSKFVSKFISGCFSQRRCTTDAWQLCIDAERRMYWRRSVQVWMLTTWVDLPLMLNFKWWKAWEPQRVTLVESWTALKPISKIHW